MNDSLKFLRGDMVIEGRGRSIGARDLKADHSSSQAHGDRPYAFIEDVVPLTDEQLRLLPVAHQYSS